MHLRGPPYFPNVAATVAVGVVDAVGAVEAVEAVEAEIVTRVSAPIAKLTAILQMHAESGNALRREETAEETTSAFATSAGSQVTSKSIASPTNV
jgi:bisphosphoglycerate-independent phosphoglycerate mutase (AlkP superfamily)